MGTKKVREMEMRKLQATGRDGESYMITLPNALVLDLKWCCSFLQACLKEDYKSGL